MEGNLAPLKDLCDLADRYELIMIVDEAHATGILGPNGAGAVTELGLCQRIPIRIGTLSKAIGSQGGFVTGSQTLIDYLWNHARTQMFSTGLSPMACGAALAAIHKMKSDSSARETLTKHIGIISQTLQGQGISIINHPQIPIIPIILNTVEKTMQAAQLLKAAGFIVAAIRPPTVPHNLARIRVSLSAVHQTEDILALAETLSHILKKL
jgi:8-amino-7-oxononanoate synthase